MKKNLFIIAIIVTATISLFGCEKKRDSGETLDITPTLSVSPASINITEAGSYLVNVTSNMAWTANVDASATWCTLTNNSATGNGVITVSIEENTAIVARIVTLTVTGGTLIRTVTITQSEAIPVLNINKTAIDATVDAATYTIDVTSNTPWTATVNSGATWCTLVYDKGTGNGTITINMAANTASVTRAATVTVASPSLIRAKTVEIEQAANTWTSGSQTWSPALRVAAGCEAVVTLSSISPPPAQYKDATNGYGYYYNYTCVQEKKDVLCPSPWRVPARDDFKVLIANTSLEELAEAWGFSGYAAGSNMNGVGLRPHVFSSSQTCVWSLTETPIIGSFFYLNYRCSMSVSGYIVDSYLGVSYTDKYSETYGYQVRCIQ